MEWPLLHSFNFGWCSAIRNIHKFPPYENYPLYSTMERRWKKMPTASWFSLKYVVYGRKRRCFGLSWYVVFTSFLYSFLHSHLNCNFAEIIGKIQTSKNFCVATLPNISVSVESGHICMCMRASTKTPSFPRRVSTRVQVFSCMHTDVDYI